MKQFIILPFILFGAQEAWAKSQKACFKVEGMTCVTCEITTKIAVKKLDGINDVQVSYKDKGAIVNYDDSKTDPLKIKESIDSTGYKATESKCEEEE